MFLATGPFLRSWWSWLRGVYDLKGQKLAVMGAGPIGLRTALELALQGAQVPREKLEGWKKSQVWKASTSFQSISWAFDGCNIVYMQRKNRRV